MSRQRVTEAYVAGLAERLSARDLQVVATLDDLRVATADQLKRLHFSDGTPAANARQAWRRLRALQDARVITTLERRVGGDGGGSTQAVFALDIAGQRLASASGPAGGLRLRRPWTPGSLFLSHALTITELYVQLREAERAGAGELLAFDAEPLCWRRFTGPAGSPTWLKPDAFVRWATTDYEYASFVEADRATASLSTIARKCDVYRRYWQSGREQERWGVFPRVVFLTPTDVRHEALVDLAACQPSDTWPLYRIARYEAAVNVVTGGTP